MGEALGEHGWEAGLIDLVLGGAEIVGDAPDGDGLGVVVVDAVGGAPVAVAWLAYAAYVDEVFFAGLDAGGESVFGVYPAVFDVDSWGVGVAEEAEGGELVGEAGHGVEFIHDVGPAGGAVEGGVDDGEIAYLANHSEVAEPLFFFFAEGVAGPLEGFLGEGIEAGDVGVDAGFFVVIAFYGGAVELSDLLEAFGGVCVVADDVANTYVLGTALGSGVF